MSTPREQVVEALAAQSGPGLPLEGVDVIGYATTITPPARSTVLVRLDEVVPSPDAPQAENLYRFALILVASATEAGTADDEIDALLEDVLFAVHKAGNLTWSRAVRGTFQDTTYPAFELTLNVPFSKE